MNWLKIAGNSIMQGASILGMEKLIFEWADKATPDQLYILIQSDKKVNLPEDVLQWAKPLYIQFRDVFDGYTPAILMEKLRAKHPELYSVLATHPKGEEWIGKRLEEIKSQLNA